LLGWYDSILPEAFGPTQTATKSGNPNALPITPLEEARVSAYFSILASYVKKSLSKLR
jgi:hypothetical protein